MLLVPKSRSSLSHHRSPRGQHHSNQQHTAVATDDSDHHHLHQQGTMQANVSTGGGNADTTSKEHHHVTTTWCIKLCKLLNLVTGLAAALGIVAHVSVLSVPAPAQDVGLRLYGILLCALSILTECEWNRLFSWVGVLENWIGRGLNNILCGILVLVFDDTTAASSEEGERTRLFRSVTGHFLLVMGIIYVVAGALCLNRVRDRHLSKLKKRDQALVQRQELESKKQEIELLLRETESQLEKI